MASDRIKPPKEEVMAKFMKANRKLGRALSSTIRAWPYLNQCWVDVINEPTILLQAHKLKNKLD